MGGGWVEVTEEKEEEEREREKEVEEKEKCGGVVGEGAGRGR